MGKSKKYGMNTKALHANKRFEPVSGDVMPPLHLSTTYINDVPGESEYFYGRVNNPTRELFERTLASLEGIENYEEQHAFAMASGMSAVSLIAELAKPGDNVVITKDVYGGTTNYFSKIIRERGVEVNFCDFADTEKLDSILNEKTKLAWIESPSNPSMNLYDLQKISEIVHVYPTLLVADSTFSTPFITRPFEHDALANVEEDNWNWHAFDTVKGSDYLADQPAVDILCKEAIDSVVELEHWGLPFSRLENGKIAQRRFGGHTVKEGEAPAFRACYAADRTGHMILQTL